MTGEDNPIDLKRLAEEATLQLLVRLARIVSAMAWGTAQHDQAFDLAADIEELQLRLERRDG